MYSDKAANDAIIIYTFNAEESKAMIEAETKRYLELKKINQDDESKRKGNPPEAQG